MDYSIIFNMFAYRTIVLYTPKGRESTIEMQLLFRLEYTFLIHYICLYDICIYVRNSNI